MTPAERQRAYRQRLQRAEIASIGAEAEASRVTLLGSLAHALAQLDTDRPADQQAATKLSVSRIIQEIVTRYGLVPGLPLRTATMGPMFNPPHPGLALRDDVLPALGLTVTEAADQLGVDRTTLSRVLNGRASISPEMALRIEAWLGKDRGGDATVWLAVQAAYDHWQAQEHFRNMPLNVQPAPWPEGPAA